jgi:hypothetical protein
MIQSFKDCKNTIYFLKSKINLFFNKNVPGTGIEPAQLALNAFETYVSTSFTIRAMNWGKIRKV